MCSDERYRELVAIGNRLGPDVLQSQDPVHPNQDEDDEQCQLIQAHLILTDTNASLSDSARRLKTRLLAG